MMEELALLEVERDYSRDQECEEFIHMLDMLLYTGLQDDNFVQIN